MPISFRRLNHIQVYIPVGKEAQAREFYSEVLGLIEIEKPEALKPNGGLWFQIADIRLHIGVENQANASKRHPAFEVDDLRVARRHLQAHNVTIKAETPPTRLRAILA